MEIRNTNQKKIILDTLAITRTHPTAQELYTLVNKNDASIGQATVYRNLKKFLDEGKIYVVKTQTGIDRYDYYGDHIHFECLNCGKIVDIYDDDLLKKMKNNKWPSNIEVRNYNVLLNGYCEECKRGNNEKI